MYWWLLMAECFFSLRQEFSAEGRHLSAIHLPRIGMILVKFPGDPCEAREDLRSQNVEVIYILLLMVQTSQTTTWDGAKTLVHHGISTTNLDWNPRRISAINSYQSAGSISIAAPNIHLLKEFLMKRSP